MASEVLLSISKDEIERARLMSEYKYAVDTQSKVVQAKREGIQEGMEKGIREGMEKGIRETARNLKNTGISLEQIHSATGLSFDEIAKL